MTASDVVEIVKLLTDNGIELYVDGGWSVDALLSEQTRPHADLDIAVRHKDVPRLRRLLESRGYGETPRDDSWECNFVLADESGHEIDVHSCTFDAEGNTIFGIQYPKDSLTGTGTIGGFRVNCISPDWLVKFHTGYELDMNDYRDVMALCERFGIELPSEYSKFRNKPV
ncbi:MAG: nucleotidyltransferase family protein [Proteobacteria bacterium]|nr:nucleotidyltransferase family protein [Pseudomonadota bacterium]